MSILGSIFGTPPDHGAEKANQKVVTAPEFDITQYVKKLGVSIGVLAGASASALKLFHVKEITTGIVAAALGLTAAALLGVCMVAAVDIAARAYVTRSTAKPEPVDGGPAGTDAAGTGGLPVGTVSQKLLVWLEGEAQPRLVLAVAGDGDKSKYLLSGDEVGERDQSKGSVPSLEGSPAWHDAKKIRAVKAAGWP
jgi:hypothetical protein